MELEDDFIAATNKKKRLSKEDLKQVPYRLYSDLLCSLPDLIFRPMLCTSKPPLET